jgi:hypothetical protein
VIDSREEKSGTELATSSLIQLHGALCRLVSHFPAVKTSYTKTKEMSSTSAFYLAGYAAIIAGLALGAHYLRIPTHWIVVGVIVLAGMGLTGLAKSRGGRR